MKILILHIVNIGYNTYTSVQFVGLYGSSIMQNILFALLNKTASLGSLKKVPLDIGYAPCLQPAQQARLGNVPYLGLETWLIIFAASSALNFPCV